MTRYEYAYQQSELRVGNLPIRISTLYPGLLPAALRFYQRRKHQLQGKMVMQGAGKQTIVPHRIPSAWNAR